jgi:hypothetical protein
LVFDFESFPIVPRHGPKKGNQYLNNIKFGFSFFIKAATLNQLKGLIVLIKV